jgi:hypothetical protein
VTNFRPRTIAHFLCCPIEKKQCGMEVENKPLREGRNWRTEKTFQIHITASSSCCGGPTGVSCCRYRSVPVPRAEKSLLFR